LLPQLVQKELDAQLREPALPELRVVCIAQRLSRVWRHHEPSQEPPALGLHLWPTGKLARRMHRSRACVDVRHDLVKQAGEGAKVHLPQGHRGLAYKGAQQGRVVLAAHGRNGNSNGRGQRPTWAQPAGARRRPPYHLGLEALRVGRIHEREQAVRRRDAGQL